MYWHIFHAIVPYILLLTCWWVVLSVGHILHAITHYTVLHTVHLLWLGSCDQDETRIVMRRLTTAGTRPGGVTCPVSRKPRAEQHRDAKIVVSG